MAGSSTALGAAQTWRPMPFASLRVHALRFEHGRSGWPREELDQCFGRLRFLCCGQDACRKNKASRILELRRQQTDQFNAGLGEDFHGLRYGELSLAHCDDVDCELIDRWTLGSW